MQQGVIIHPARVLYLIFHHIANLFSHPNRYFEGIFIDWAHNHAYLKVWVKGSANGKLWGGRCAGKPAREIALTGSEILACGSSEIIHYVDSEITAVPAVVKKNGSPQGCGILSLLPEAAISLARQSQFRSAKAEFHSSRRREFHFALQSEYLPYNFPFVEKLFGTHMNHN
ncbi:MAG: hypothetical protein E7034_01250 [Akkermansiaceae bacterium]|nr:hypothetical protein [Akkermansiaceae bacterium]